MTQKTFQLPAIEATANAALAAQLQHKIDTKTKPLGALGQLENLTLQLGLIQRSDTLAFAAPQLVVFAADHGIASEGVSAFPQAVTMQMVANMLARGAAINVLARQHGFAMHVVDAGMASDLPNDLHNDLPNDLTRHPQLIKRKIAHGTHNLALGAAMTAHQLNAALQAGSDVLQALPGNVVAFGDMGIANTSAAALLLHRLAGVSIEDATGRGTGLTDPQLLHKQAVLSKAAALHAAATEPLEALAALGGFEIAMMAGAMLQAASERRVILVDGFIAGSAALAACALAPAAKDYMVFCHRSAERGHQLLLAHLQAKPLLDVGMRLGEGTGALLAWPLVQSAALLMNEMASFESAGVSSKT